MSATVSGLTETESRDQSAEHLYADLSTPPPAEKRLHCQEVYALDLMLHHPLCGPSDIPHIESCIADRITMLIQELAEAPARLNLMITAEVHHQLRARPDFQTDRLVIEQWVPALGYWLVCATHSRDEDYGVIIRQLKEGDPRFKTPTQQLDETRELAKANAARHEADSADRIKGAIDGLTRKGRDQFLAVEQAIKTGETIIAHGADLDFVEKGHAHTQRLAEQGDSASQAVLSGTFRDGVACLNPKDNPQRR